MAAARPGIFGIFYTFHLASRIGKERDQEAVGSMQQAVAVGNRVVMMNRGRILADIGGAERANLQYRDLIERFRSLHTASELTDRAVLS